MHSINSNCPAKSTTISFIGRIMNISVHFIARCLCFALGTWAVACVVYWRSRMLIKAPANTTKIENEWVCLAEPNVLRRYKLPCFRLLWMAEKQAFVVWCATAIVRQARYIAMGQLNANGGGGRLIMSFSRYCISDEKWCECV